MPDATLDRSFANLISGLATEATTIRLGSQSLRGPTAQGGQDRASPGRAFLSHGWLLEKLEDTERAIAQALRICDTPDDVYAGEQRRLEALHGVEPVSKQEDLRLVLGAAGRRLRGWSEFVESFEFDAIERVVEAPDA